jgi:light-regulated signal transduction histidine kinase (bacteriophytochrome)
MSGPEQTDLDLSRCAAEPIDRPGGVQAHGALLVLHEPDLIIDQVSANLAGFLGVAPEEALGRPLALVLPAETVAAIAGLLDAQPEASQGFPVLRLIAGDRRTPLFASLHRRDGCTLLELELAGSGNEPQAGDAESGESFASLEATFQSTLDEAGNVFEVARALAELAAEIGRWDRTAVYRFLPDWSGEVIAEVRRPAATAFLGLRFPATDVPRRTRSLISTTSLRVTADSHSDPVPLVPLVNPRTGRATDLTHAILRAVAPIHLQYLRNMGVAAALNGTLMSEDRLWGLLACHQDSPRIPSPLLRERLARLSRQAAAAISRLDQHQRIEAERQVARRLAMVERAVPDADNVVRGLIASDPGILDLAQADGVAICAEQGVASFGQTPDVATLQALARLVAARPDRMLVTDCLTAIDAEFAACRDAAAGMMAVAVAVSEQPLVALLAFRREVVHEVIWGGDPSRPLELEGETLTPRKSFQQWRETVVGHCRAWEPETVAAWHALPAWLATAFGSYDRAAQRMVEDLRRVLPPARFDEPFLRALLNSVPGTLVVADGITGPARVMLINREFRRIFGVAPDELIGLPLDQALLQVGLGDPRIAALKPGGTLAATVISAGVGECNIQISRRALVRLCDHDQDSAFTAWVFEDVTRAHRVEQALQSARDQAVVASRAKSEFLASMSHELRTPLNAIIGFSEIMRAELFGALGSPKYAEYVRNIQTSGEHLLHVIGEVLDISKVEAGHYVLEEQVINLCSLIQDICLLESDQADRAGVKLMQELSQRELFLQCDERALKQILLNLLSNAFKFTPSGGMVTCRSLLLPSGAIAVEVQDTGVGIPEEHLNRVLDPFIQVGDRQTRKMGTGLGLSLVRVLAELHGGRVTLNSQSGRGTALRITFPPWRTMPADAVIIPGGLIPARPI